jgi:hypothetical protein
VGLLDILRGQRRPKRADLDRLFAITTAATTLEAGMGIVATGRAGVCFRAIDGGVFDELVREVEQILALAGSEFGTRVSRHEDSFGFSWVVLSDPQLDDLVTATHLVSQTLEERGFSEQLLCAVFGFRGEAGPVFLVYAYKRGAFYPFVPRGERDRDNTLELRLQAALGGEMPIEPELERWYPVWDAPVDPAMQDRA